MKHTFTKKLFALALAAGMLAASTLTASATEWVSPYTFDASSVVSTKEETVPGETKPKTVRTIKAGTAITVTQKEDFPHTILNVRVSEVGNPENMYLFYNRGEWPKTKVAAIDPVTVKFETLKDAEGKTINLAKPGKLYMLAVDVFSMADPASPDGIFYGGYAYTYFRIEGDSTTSTPLAPPKNNDKSGGMTQEEKDFIGEGTPAISDGTLDVSGGVSPPVMQ